MLRSWRLFEWPTENWKGVIQRLFNAVFGQSIREFPRFGIAPWKWHGKREPADHNNCSDGRKLLANECRIIRCCAAKHYKPSKWANHKRWTKLPWCAKTTWHHPQKVVSFTAGEESSVALRDEKPLFGNTVVPPLLIHYWIAYVDTISKLYELVFIFI